MRVQMSLVGRLNFPLPALISLSILVLFLNYLYLYLFTAFMIEQEDPDCTEEIEIAHHIQQLFQCTYKDDWVAEQFLIQRNRLWTKVFNRLVKEGFIARKRTYRGYQYKWSAVMP
jgi:hypothetical protein